MKDTKNQFLALNLHFQVSNLQSLDVISIEYLPSPILDVVERRILELQDETRFNCCPNFFPKPGWNKKVNKILFRFFTMRSHGITLSDLMAQLSCDIFLPNNPLRSQGYRMPHFLSMYNLVNDCSVGKILYRHINHSYWIIKNT